MVLITEDLVRKRAEHNEKIIGTLEELSLHQEDIERIEHLNNWCKELQILYLQANLIPKIENLNKLKKLEYLNLAINNIEKIENLEQCESLNKLDLTLNFIWDLESVCSLKNNIFLKYLNLTGNPCADFKGYRDYVIAQLPQLEMLDSIKITKSEKIKALQKLPQIQNLLKIEQEKYKEFRLKQKLSHRDTSKLSDEEFWKTPSEHSPETRIEIALRSKNQKQIDSNENPKKNGIRLFTKNGRPLNINQAKIPFTFCDEDPNQFVLTVKVYKYLDTALIDVDLQPIYIKVTIKGKIFQIVFPEEISIDKSTCQRSMITGYLVIKMPKAIYQIQTEKHKKFEKNKIMENDKKKNNFLEVPDKSDNFDFSKILVNEEKNTFLKCREVPPLEYCFRHNS